MGGININTQASSDARIRPRHASTLIIVDASGEAPRILMGRRRPDQVFLPNKFVFPGGRLERADRGFPCSDELSSLDQARLMKAVGASPSAKLPKALALAAIRETFEETGFVVGKPISANEEQLAKRRKDTTTSPWSSFLATGFSPSLTCLRFFARAITPPGRPRRYDTRFFSVDASAITHRIERMDGELSSLAWFTLREAEELDLPIITRRILADLADHLATASDKRQTPPVPFYFHRRGVAERVLIP